MKRILLIFALTIIAHAAFGQAPKPPMTKIVQRYIASNVPADSFAAKPKTIYMAGDKLSRLEEEPDPEQHVHGLMICNEPDIWMINLLGSQGQHMVDPGPDLTVHNMIFGEDAPRELAPLEFGRELDFFKQNAATHLEPQTIDGQKCDASEFKHANYRLVLYVRQDTHKPFHLDVFKDGKAEFSVRYISYETDIPFNAALFTPPPGVTITEAAPDPKAPPK